MANGQEQEWRVTRERMKRVCVMGYVCHMINSAHEIHSTIISLTHHCSTHLSAIVWWTSLFLSFFSSSSFFFLSFPTIHPVFEVNKIMSVLFRAWCRPGDIPFSLPLYYPLLSLYQCWYSTHKLMQGDTEKKRRTTLYIHSLSPFIFFLFLSNWLLHNFYRHSFTRLDRWNLIQE